MPDYRFEIHIGGATWTIREPVGSEQELLTDANCTACCIHSSQEIIVNPTAPDLESVILHELLHAWMFSSGMEEVLRSKGCEDLHEAIVIALQDKLYDSVRNNPQFWRYIIDSDRRAGNSGA